MAFAPSMVSSDGWPMSITVPCQLLFSATRARATPIMVVMWMSCPQACITPTSCSGGVLRLYGAGVGNSGLFDDGQRVEIGADEQRGAIAVLEDGDDSVGLAAVGIFADVFGNGVAGFAQFLGEQGGGVLFVMRELGVGVDSLVGIDQAGEFVVDEGGKVLREQGHCDEAEERQDDDGRATGKAFMESPAEVFRVYKRHRPESGWSLMWNAG